MPATGSLATPSTTYGRSRCSHTALRCGGLIPAGFSRVQVSARVFTPGRSPGCRYEKRGGQSTTPLPHWLLTTGHFLLSRQIPQRIDRVVADLEHEVDVRAGRHPGAADFADYLALVHVLPGLDIDGVHVAVDGRGAVEVIDLDVEAETAIAPAGVLDRAAVRGQHRRAQRGGQI